LIRSGVRPSPAAGKSIGKAISVVTKPRAPLAIIVTSRNSRKLTDSTIAVNPNSRKRRSAA